ncbi:hypothetical protein [Dactylosporangium salmoneum]|uniref:Enhanced intracellular survival protein domain-containing protein n=1 Tax=Dactylosporangium salmoneum TaxID=53361 RepID=A0ABN3HXW6_9ACTN
MALRRKGSRTVVVDGRRYRWVITLRAEPVQGVVVELAEGPASRLVAYTNEFAVITPGMVALGIRAALSAGWEPDMRGPDFRLADDLWGPPLLTP